MIISHGSVWEYIYIAQHTWLFHCSFESNCTVLRFQSGMSEIWVTVLVGRCALPLLPMSRNVCLQILKFGACVPWQHAPNTYIYNYVHCISPTDWYEDSQPKYYFWKETHNILLDIVVAIPAMHRFLMTKVACLVFVWQHQSKTYKWICQTSHTYIFRSCVPTVATHLRPWVQHIALDLGF